MQVPSSLSVIFPVYNEEANLQKAISKAEGFLKTNLPDFEIIIVNDGSTDNTFKIAQGLSEKDRRIKLVNHERNLGYGAALISGFNIAKKGLIFLTDADLQFDFKEIKNFLEYISEYDALIGFRYSRSDPLMRKIIAWAWNEMVGLIYGVKIRDVNCAFKLFKRDSIKKIDLKSKGAMLPAELVIKLQRGGYKIKEMPVSHFPRKAGTPKGVSPKVILLAFYEFLRVYFDLLPKLQLQFLKYCLIGFLNVILDLSLYLILTSYVNIFASYYLLAKTTSIAIALSNGFVWNRLWTFNSKNSSLVLQLAKFLIVQGFIIGLNVATMYAMVKLLSLSEIFGLILATSVSAIAGFSLSKFWVFAERK